MEILNLYAGIGGNRKLWKDVKVTAIENDIKIAKIYEKHFPGDNIIIGDARKYLLNHYKEFDFIWSSPPCPSHSIVRKSGVVHNLNKPVFPDLRLYEEIIFLKHHFKGLWVVENVNPYYEPLIKPYHVNRHCFWANFYIPGKKFKSGNIKNLIYSSEQYGFNVKNERVNYGSRKDQILRNTVNPDLGKYILDCAFKNRQKLITECFYKI